MKSSHIAFSALSAAVLLLALVSAGCTGTGNNNPGTLPTPTATTAVSGDLMNSGMVGTWQATLNIPKYENLTDVIYSFNADGTGKAYYYHKWNENVNAAVPFTWTIGNSKLNTFDLVYPTINSSETFTLLDDKKTIYDGYDRYKKVIANEGLITGTWKSVSPYSRDDKMYDISYTFNADGAGNDAWYLDGNLTDSDSIIWDFLCVNDNDEYVYYMDYPKYLAYNIQELYYLSPKDMILKDKYNMTYLRE